MVTVANVVQRYTSHVFLPGPRLNLTSTSYFSSRESRINKCAKYTERIFKSNDKLILNYILISVKLPISLGLPGDQKRRRFLCGNDWLDHLDLVSENCVFLAMHINFVYCWHLYRPMNAFRRCSAGKNILQCIWWRMIKVGELWVTVVFIYKKKYFSVYFKILFSVSLTPRS